MPHVLAVVRTPARAALALVLALATLAVVPQTAQAEVIRPLASQYDADVFGDYRIVGNGNMGCPTGTEPYAGEPGVSGANSDCQLGQARTTPSGQSRVPLNDFFFMRWADVDGDASTYNSSTADLTIPAGSTIRHAELNWAANTGQLRQDANGFYAAPGCSTRQYATGRPGAVTPSGTPAASSVRLTVDGTSTSIAASSGRYAVDPLATIPNNSAQYYSVGVDVTSLLTGVVGGSSTPITVANIWAPEGYNCFAGWSLTVVWAFDEPNAAAPAKRSVQLFDGHVRQASNDPETTTSITGLRPTNSSVRVATTAYEGDAGITGDYFEINNVRQTEPLTSATDNFFTGNAQRNGGAPNVSNNFSVDAKTIAVTAIPGGSTTADLTFGTSGDSYLATTLALSVPVPEVRLSKVAGATQVAPGDPITFDIAITNPTDAEITDLVVADPQFPDCDATYPIIAASSTISYTCTTVAPADDFINVATVEGTDPTGTTVTDTAESDPVEVLNPAIALTKGADAATYESGETVTFTLEVTNAGDTQLSNVSVTDAVVPDCDRSFATLAVGASQSWTCTTTAPVAGAANTADATAQDDLGQVVTATATAPARTNGSVSGLVFSDVDGDGVVDAEDVGIGGVDINLTGTPDAGGSLSLSTTTLPDGSWSFDSVPSGTYTVTEVQPTAYVDGLDTAGTNAVLSANDEVGVSLADAGTSTGTLFAELARASLAGSVYDDIDGDGLRGSGEPGIGGVAIVATGTTSDGNAASASTTTASDGSWSLGGLPGGTYTVTETQPAGFADAQDVAGTAGGNPTEPDTITDVMVGPSEAATGYDFGEVRLGSLSGSVETDTGTALQGVQIVLGGTDDLGATVSETTLTGADGSYSFTDLRPGTYALLQSQPAAYGPGSVEAGSTGGAVDGANAVNSIVLESGEIATAYDFTETTASLAGLVFNDVDGDGTQDPGELGFGSVDVVVEDDVRGDTFPRTTAPDGTYSVAGLPAGDYTVTMTEPSGFTATTTNPRSEPVGPGEDVVDVDFGLDAVNTDPTAVDDSDSTPLDTPIDVTVVSNDTDPEGDTLTVTSNTQPTNGSASCTTAGVCTYTPDAGFTGTDTFDYTISDGNGGTDTATVTITVDPAPNTAPTAVDDSDSTPLDTPVDVAVLGNDTDPEGDTLTVTSNTQPTNGAASCTTAGVCTYTPDVGFTGTDTFTYTISDGNGGTDTATVTITVDPAPNTAPTAVDDSDTTPFETPIDVAVLGNDTDPEGDTLTVDSFTQPGNGTVTCTATDCTYTPDAGFTGTDTFTYTISDGNGGTDTATVTITVDPAPNTDPTAVDDSDSTPLDTPIDVTVVSNDTDPEGDTLTVTSNTQPTNGAASCTTAGVCTYTPDAGFTGTDTFDYTISDGNGGTDSATVTITVDPAPNTAPTAVDDTDTTPFETPIDVTVVSNDTDPEGDTLTVTSNTQPTNGSASCTTAGVCTYTPDAGFTGVDTFDYTISDGNGGTDTATVTITVDPAPNTDPTAVDDSDSTPLDTPIDVAVLGNDTDPEGDTPTVTSNTQPTNGAASCTTAGVCTYTPDAGFTGVDTFDYTISDGNGGTDSATVTITVDPAPNTDPTAVDDSDSTPLDTPIDVAVLGNDTDPEGDTLTVTSNTQPTNGAASCTTAGVCTYTPDAGFTGVDTFDYTITDGNGGTDSATVTITVDPAPNTDPTAVDDSDSTPLDTPIDVAVLGNDTDPEGDTLTVTSNTQPTNGAASCTTAGVCTYTPDAGFTGVDTFDYTISDGNGGTDTATVTITVDPAGSTPPTAVDDSDSTPLDTPIDVAVLGNDTDPEGDTLTVTSNTQPTNGSASCTTAGVCTYTPDAGFTGTDTFTYTISDGNVGTDTATVTITVDPAGSTPPTAVDDSGSTPFETAVTVGVLGNDSDPEGDTLTVTSNTQPGNGTVTCTATDCTYTPDAGFTGVDTFTYTVSDGNGGTDTATVTITVDPAPNTAPTAVDDSDTTPFETPIDVTVVSNDTDPEGDTLTVTSFTQPTNGSASCTTAGLCTYTPDAGFTGTDTFDYTISDGNGGTDTATVTITVDPAPNTDPTAVDDSDSTPLDTPIDVAVLGNDTDPEGDTLTVTSNTQPSNGSASCTTAGVCTYTPDVGFTGTDTFTYTISDGNGGTDTATVTITVDPAPNTAPTAVDDSDTTPFETPIDVAVLGNDTDPEGDTLTVDSFTQPGNGTVTCTATDCTYTPDAGFTGTDTFTYTISDGNGGTDTATVTITVDPAPNTDPTAVDDSRSTPFETPITVPVLGNDSDPDGDTVTVTSNTQPTNGTVTCTTAGVCTYTPDPGFTGTDTFTYTVSDGNGGTDTATVTITVGAAPQPPVNPPVDPPVNDPPVFDATPSRTVQVGEPLAPVTAQDLNGDDLTFTLTDGELPPGVTLNPDGTLSGTPTTPGTYEAIITVTDGRGGIDTVVLGITVPGPPIPAEVPVEDLPDSGAAATSLAGLALMMLLLGALMLRGARRRVTPFG